MRLNQLGDIKTIKNAFNKGCDAIIYSVTFLFKEIIFAWPRAIFIAMPLASRDVRAISKAKAAFIPQIREVSELAKHLFERVPTCIDKIQKITGVLSKLADASQGVTCDLTLEILEQHRSNFQQLGAFINTILLPDDDEFSADTKEFLPELVQTAALLNGLIDDLSGRSGLFSTSKKKSEPGSTIAAKAQAVIVKESAGELSESPVNPFADAGVGLIDEAPIMMAEAHRAARIAGTSKPPRSCVILRPVPIHVNVHTADEEKFLKDTKAISTTKKLSFADYIVSFVHFIAMDIIIGIPKFLAYDLPQLIIGFQKCTSSIVSNIHPTAKSLIELKDILKELHRLVLQLDRLAPIINGVELYLAKNIEPDAKALKDNYLLIMAALSNTIESLDIKQVQSIKKDMKSLLFKINPLLINALDALHGNSLFSAAMKKRATVSPKAGGDGASQQTGSSSSSSGPHEVLGAEKERPKSRGVEEQIKGAFVSLGRVIKTAMRTPESGGGTTASGVSAAPGDD